MTPENQFGQKKEDQVRTELLGRYITLADRLLETAVQHSKAWKRTIFVISQDQAQCLHDQVITSGIGEFIQGHTHHETHKEYPSANSTRAVIVAEEFDYAHAAEERKWEAPPQYKQRLLHLELHYANNDPYLEYDEQDKYYEIMPKAEPYRLKLQIEAGTADVVSYVISSKYIETGYEGHDWGTTRDVETAKLQSLYDVFENFAKQQVKEKPMEEQLAEIVLVDESSGQRLYYNSDKKDWEVPLDDAKEQSGSEIPPVAEGEEATFRVANTYRIEIVRDPADEQEAED